MVQTSKFDINVMLNSLELLGCEYEPEEKSISKKKAEIAKVLDEEIKKIEDNETLNGQPIEVYDCIECEALSFDVTKCMYCGHELDEDDIGENTMSLEDFVNSVFGEKDTKKSSPPKGKSKAKAKPAQDEDDEDDEDDEVEQKPKRQTKTSSTRSNAKVKPNDEDEEDEDDEEEIKVPEKPKRQTKTSPSRSKAKPADEDEDNEDEDEDEKPSRPTRSNRSETKSAPKAEAKPTTKTAAKPKQSQVTITLNINGVDVKFPAIID